MDMVMLATAIIAVYGLPTLIAVGREHHQTAAILIVNLFLGWTFLGWVVALAWAASATPTPSRHAWPQEKGRAS